MSLIKKFFKHRGSKKKINGYIEYFGLEEWWMNTFTQDERDHINEIFKPLGLDPNEKSLIDGELTHSDSTHVSLLSNLAGWFRSPNDRHIGRSIIEKSLELCDEKSVGILDKHFAFSGAIPIFYRDRKDLSILQKTIKVCLSQIAIAPEAAQAFLKEYPESPLPTHVGFKQLAIIYDKQGKIPKAIKLCRQAKEQGWNGDWKKRIERYKKKLVNNTIKQAGSN